MRLGLPFPCKECRGVLYIWKLTEFTWRGYKQWLLNKWARRKTIWASRSVCCRERSLWLFFLSLSSSLWQTAAHEHYLLDYSTHAVFHFGSRKWKLALLFPTWIERNQYDSENIADSRDLEHQNASKFQVILIMRPEL